MNEKPKQPETSSSPEKGIFEPKNPKNLKIVAISDTHTKHHRLEIPPGDLLIHAGDFTNRGSLKDVEVFNEFLGTLPHRYKIVIAGNHDFCFERQPSEARALLTNCIYLEDEGVEIEGVRIYGSPWQPEFHNWAFNLKRGEALAQKWALIPEDTDILITHGPPYGYLDKVFLGGRQVGCEDLLQRVKEIKPKYHIFGHIHEAAGIDSNGHTTFINASSCTFAYKPKNPPILLEWPPNKEED